METDASLNRLLIKLTNTLLTSADTQTRLRHSAFERKRVGANIEYARALLLTLEKQSSTVRIQSQRQHIQADLQRKREQVKRLNARLRELEQLAEDSDDSEDEDAPEINQYAPVKADTQGGLDTGTSQNALGSPPGQQPELRSRRPLQASDNRDAASTSAREQLFAGRPNPDAASSSSLQRHEALMTHHRAEQDTLTDSLLSLARQLKESSLQIGASIAGEKDVLGRATAELDKSSQGMEAAQRRMGTLRKMSEGQGWWGRLKLYAMIAGLWLGCFLLVFVCPKLRF